jgi:CRISPR-associated protein Csx10
MEATSSLNGVLTITLLSDACFFQPSSRHVLVDAETCADELGLPMIPGKTLHGLLRDTWLSCVEAMSDGTDTGYALLGQPQAHDDTQPGILRIGRALMPEPIRDRVRWATMRRDNPLPGEAVRTAFFWTRTGTAVNAATGAPRTDTLRGVRVVPAGTVLHAPIQSSRLLKPEERDLLCLLANLTRHGGIERNRGLGHLLLAVSWNDEGKTPESEPTGGMEELASDAEGAAQGDARELLHYRMTLTAPCILHGDDLDPNSCKTLDYLTGSTVRGAVARALDAMAGRAPEGSEERMRIETALRRIIADEEAEFLNAYFESFDARRPIPTPITWRREKSIGLSDKDANPYDKAAVFTEDADEPEEQTEPLKTRYITPDHGTLVPTGGEGWSRIAMETHQTRYRERGVPQPGKSTVYVYEAIRPGEVLRGAVRVPPDLVETVAAALEGGELRLGRSARAHYGGAPRVTVVAAAPNDEADRPWPVQKGERFEIVLTSPALLRHPLTGQHDPSYLGCAVQKRFHDAATVATCVLKSMEDGDGSSGDAASDAPLAVFVKGATARGYVRQWRTELPRLPAAAAGSVVVLEADRDLTGDELATLCAEPLGERTADGYGRFIAREMRRDLSLTLPSGESEEPPEPTEAADATLVAAQKRLYRSVLRGLLVNEVLRRKQEADLPTPRITPSLLHRFRGALRSEDWPETFRGWFAASLVDPKRLRPTAYEAAKRVRLQPLNDAPEDRGVRKPLTETLRQAAAPDWVPPIPIEKGGDWRNYALLPLAQAEREWNNARRELREFFLDRLLGALAKRSAREAEEAAEAERATAAGSAARDGSRASSREEG